MSELALHTAAKRHSVSQGVPLAGCPMQIVLVALALRKLECMHIAIDLIYRFVSSRERSGWRKNTTNTHGVADCMAPRKTANGKL